jgi:microcystin-dependent protein
MARTQQCAAAAILTLCVGGASGQISRTGATGAGLSFPNMQPSASARFVLQAQGAPSAFGIGVPIRVFASGYTPSAAWIPCDGRLLPIQTNQALFAQLGVTFGGNGTTNFAVPDLRGRVAMGTGAGPLLTSRALGDRVGSETGTLTVANLPAHTHSTPDGVCGVTGSGVPFSNMQPTTALNVSIVQTGSYPPRDTGFAVGPSQPYLGQLLLQAAPSPNATFLTPANGALRVLSQNTALFSLLGTYYGGNATTNFAVPDLRGRVIVGGGTGLALTPRSTGEVFGSETVTLTTQLIASHQHALLNGTQTSATGGSQPHNTLQPSLVITYGIAVDGIYPGSGMDDTLGYIGEIIMFAGNFAPGGYLPCDGRLLPISQYDTLFSLIGTTYGGDGQVTFALPDYRGRVLVGDDATHPLGWRSGTEFVTLTTTQLAAHSHTVPCAADFNHDGALDFFDYLDFVNAFAQGQGAGDYNRDGVIDFFDYLDFVQAFSGGC